MVKASKVASSFNVLGRFKKSLGKGGELNVLLLLSSLTFDENDAQRTHRMIDCEVRLVKDFGGGKARDMEWSIVDDEKNRLFGE
mmetsp:Transcript_11841/g.23956  ORF Transcript_11841/g.23956 Transcript_11841/m.23956 type:complete len:84 (+) Transcript_11841:271-522(+)